MTYLFCFSDEGGLGEAALMFLCIFLLIRLYNNIAKGTAFFGYSLEYWEVFMNF